MTKLHSIQTLRGIAASLVILSHSLEALQNYGLASSAFSQLYWYIGWAGVRVFFVISGFIMMRTSYNNFGTPLGALDFFKKRLIRIVPIYYIATGIMCMSLILLGKNVGVVNLLTSLLFIPNAFVHNGLAEPIVGQGWTLNYEMFFYLTFAFCLVFPINTAVIVFMTFYLLLLLFPYFGFLHENHSLHSTVAGFYSDPIIILFVIGVFIAIVKEKWPNLINIRFPILKVGIIISVDILLYSIFSVKISGDVYRFFSFGVSALCVAACVYGENTKMNAIDDVWERFGDASYSTYLFHTFVLALLNRVFNLHHPVWNFVYIILALIGGNFIGYGLHLAIERPISLALRRRSLSVGRDGGRQTAKA